MSSVSGYAEKNLLILKKIESDLELLPSVFSDYCNYLRNNNKSSTTVQSYLGTLLVCLRTIFKEYYICDECFYEKLNTENIQAYFEEKSDLGVKTLQSHWSVLNSFFKYLVEENYVKTNPMDTIKRPNNSDQPRKLNFLTKHEFDVLLSTIRYSPTKFTAFRDEIIIKLAVSTGLDISDLLNLNFDHIDFVNSTLSVTNKKGTRIIPLESNMLVLLKNWSQFRNQYFKGSDTPALFVSSLKRRLSADAASEMLAKYCERANVPRITFKDLKSTMIYLFARENVSMEAIMELLDTSDYMNVVQAFDAAMKERKVGIHDVLNKLFDEPVAKRADFQNNRAFDLEIKLPEYSTYRGGEKGFTLYVNVTNRLVQPLKLRLKLCAIYMNGMLRNSDYIYTGYQFDEEFIFPKTAKTFGKIWITDSMNNKQLRTGDYLLITLLNTDIDVEYHVKYIFNETPMGSCWEEENWYEIDLGPLPMK